MASRSSSDYSIAWICALAVEMTAARAMLHEEHGKPPDQASSDDNTYCLGRIGSYNIVITCLPSGVYGVSSAAVVGTRIRQTFRNLKYALMVGIGGGAPHEGVDIRLGDVVVSKPGRGSGGIIQFDMGKEHGNGLFERVGSLNQPPEELLKALAYLEAEHLISGSRIPELLDLAYDRYPQLASTFSYPGQDNDVLFDFEYNHCGPLPTCKSCDRSKLVQRPPRHKTSPRVFQGLIASGNQVMKHGATRERLREELGVICFEMEAAGLMNILPCLVIRGICDYADSHKNKQWQPYAAMTAAAFASEVLQTLPSQSNQAFIKSVEIAFGKEECWSVVQESLTWLEPRRIMEMLKVVPHRAHSARAVVDPDDPELYWVSKNADYDEWRSPDTKHSVLCLSATDAADLDGAVSCIQRIYATDTTGTVMFKLSWADLFNTQSFSRTFVHVTLLALLESLPEGDRIPAISRFLRSVLEHLSLSDKHQLSKLWHPSENKESYVQLVQALLRLDAAQRCAVLMAPLLHQHKSCLIIIRSQDTWDSTLFEFVAGINDELRTCREGSTHLKIIVSGATNTALQDSWDVRHLLHIQKDLERADCLSALFSDNIRYQKIIDSHAESLQWLWKHKEYLEWSIAPTSRLLYLEGKPGSGKSTLTKYLREHLVSKIVCDQPPIIADFFYSRRDGDREKHHQTMFRRLLWNILHQDSTLFYHFQNQYRLFQDGSTASMNQWNLVSLQTILRSITQHPVRKQIYLILDAMDESDVSDRREVLSFLLSLCDRPGQCVFKIFLASRPMTELHHNLKSFANLNLIRMQDETLEDIRQFARSFLGPELNFTGRLLEDATEYIVNTAQGVFLWVQLIRQELQVCVERGYRKREIFKMLLELPTELEAFYLHMLKSLAKGSSEDIENGRCMFQFVFYAARSLTITEIQHLLAMDAVLRDGLEVTDEVFTDELIHGMETRIIHCSGNFLEIKGSNLVQPIHQTVREFLLPRDAPAQGHSTPRSIFRLDDESKVHATIARACVRYLQLMASTESFGPIKDWNTAAFERYAAYLNTRLLLPYVLKFLLHHTQKSSEGWDVQALLQEVMPLLHDTAICYLLANWLRTKLQQVVPAVSWSGLRIRFELQLLHAAARKNMVEVVDIILSLGADVDKPLDGQTVLQVAAAHGSEELVIRLLSRDADSQVGFEGDRNLLHLAALRGHAGVVRWVWRQPGVRTTDGQGLTPLHHAACSGNLEIVHFLLEHGASVDAIDRVNRWRPLHWAAFHGQLSVIEYLLDRYSEYETQSAPSIEDKDTKMRTALYISAANGQADAVKLLLKRGANPHIRDNNGYTPLIKAAADGNERVVHEILDWDLELCLETDNEGRTPLLHAAARGHTSVVQTLAFIQTDADLRSAQNRTALHLATTQNHTSTIRLLINLGASPDAQDFHGTTAMHIAAFNGFLESVRTLIEYDASTRVVDRYGRDALYLAAGRGHTAVSELLLQQLDTRANATDIRGWTPLFWAAGNGHGGAVSLLARYGADVDIRDRNGITPLHWAARKEQLEVVEILLLLKAHGSTNITGGKGEINQSKSDLAKLAKLLVAMMRQKSSLELWRGYEETMPEV